MTPFQGQVLDQAQVKENKEKEKAREEARNGNTPTRNGRGRSSGNNTGGSDIEREETVRYINKEENPDHDVHNS
jgi:hypothetical protein